MDGSQERRVEWDEDKRLNTLKKHQIDFIEAAEVLFLPCVRYPSPRGDELRYVAIGPLGNGNIIAVVYLEREGRLRLITARRARDNERNAYLHAFGTPQAEGKD